MDKEKTMCNEYEYICPDCGANLDLIDAVARKRTQEVVAEVFSCPNGCGIFSDYGFGLKPGGCYGFY